jgi:hypothetical protein
VSDLTISTTLPFHDFDLQKPNYTPLPTLTAVHTGPQLLDIYQIYTTTIDPPHTYEPRHYPTNTPFKDFHIHLQAYLPACRPNLVKIPKLASQLSKLAMQSCRRKNRLADRQPKGHLWKSTEAMMAMTRATRGLDLYNGKINPMMADTHDHRSSPGNCAWNGVSIMS